jgi:hypothetical protein
VATTTRRARWQAAAAELVQVSVGHVVELAYGADPHPEHAIAADGVAHQRGASLPKRQTLSSITARAKTTLGRTA